VGHKSLFCYLIEQYDGLLSNKIAFCLIRLKKLPFLVLTIAMRGLE